MIYKPTSIIKSTLIIFGFSLFLTMNCLAQSDSLIVKKLQTVVFYNVNLIPMNQEGAIPHQSVLIEDGLIKAIGNATDIEIPEGTEVIDASNSFLMPGLMDMHVHIFSEDELLLYLVNGVTTVRNLWGWKAHLKMKNDVENGKLIGPTIYTSGRIIDGKPARLRGSAEIDNVIKAREEVKSQAKDGYEFIKVYDFLKTDVYSAIILEAQKYNMPVVGHVPKNVGLYSTFLSGQSSIEHLDGFLKVSTKDSVVVGQVIWIVLHYSIIHH